MDEDMLRNCIHWLKYTTFQQKFSKYLMMTISIETYSTRELWKSNFKIKKAWIKKKLTQFWMCYGD
jgi:hypothetical protein